MEKKTILIVDDDEHCRDTLSIVFENEGYNVITAQTGTEALKFLKTKAIDLIFMDVMLPGLEGLEIKGSIPTADLREYQKLSSYSLQVSLLQPHNRKNVKLKQ